MLARSRGSRIPPISPQQSIFVSEDQRTVACISSPERRILIRRGADIPPLFVKAILASEDKNFFSHEGVDKAAILRALGQAGLGESHSGASTLTMQIAKHLRGGTGRASTEIEKIGDIVTALRLERQYPREQLLLSYVNMPYFGRGSYGIEAASRAYFDKPAADLALYEVAFVVSLINKPALPDRSFATDPLLKARGDVVDANWSEAARGTLRVLALMLDQGVISELDNARATTLVEKSLRKEVVAPSRACGAHDHFLERVRVLYKDRFPINTGGLTISITRDDALQDVLAKAVDLTLRTYVARHPDDADNNLLRAGAFAVDFSGDVLAEVGNVNFKDLSTTSWRAAGASRGRRSRSSRTVRSSSASRSRRSPTSRRSRTCRTSWRRSSSAAACSMRRTPCRSGRGRGVKVIENFHSRSEPQYRGEISCRIALGESRNTAAMRAGVKRRHQERDRSRVSRWPAEGPEAHPPAVSDDRHRRFRGQSALDGIDGRVRQRRVSRDAALRQRRLPRRQVAAAHGCRRPARRLRSQGREAPRRWSA